MEISDVPFSSPSDVPFSSPTGIKYITPGGEANIPQRIVDWLQDGNKNGLGYAIEIVDFPIP